MEAKPKFVYYASSNPGKLDEYREAAEAEVGTGVAIEMLPGIESMAPPEETGTTFRANAELKAEYYSRIHGGLVFADDSGLCIDALNGAPGVLSARYGGNCSDKEKVALVLSELDGVRCRTAKFVCSIAVAGGGTVLATFESSVAGEILHVCNGSGGFGYDPIFYYPPHGLTFAEMPVSRKRAVSHRGNAFRLFLKWLDQNPNS